MTITLVTFFSLFTGIHVFIAWISFLTVRRIKKNVDDKYKVEQKLADSNHQNQELETKISQLEEIVEKQKMEIRGKGVIEEKHSMIKNMNDKLLSLVNPQFLENILNPLIDKIRTLEEQKKHLQLQINTLEIGEEQEKCKQELLEINQKLEQLQKEKNDIDYILSSMRHFTERTEKRLDAAKSLMDDESNLDEEARQFYRKSKSDDSQGKQT